MNKTFSMAHIRQTRLGNRFLKNKFQANKTAYLKQGSCCIFIRRKTKRDYYGNSNKRGIIDNKCFRETIKLFFF